MSLSTVVSRRKLLFSLRFRDSALAVEFLLWGQGDKAVNLLC